MNARHMLVRVIVGSILIAMAMGQTALYAQERDEPAEPAAAEARKRRAAAAQGEWRKLFEELEAQGITREMLGELFKRKEKGEELKPEEEEAIRKVMALKKRTDPARGRRGGRQRRPGDKVLDRWLGTWFCDVIVKPCVWVPEETQQFELREVKWALRGRFQETTVRSSDYEMREFQNSDGNGKTFRKWHFGTQRFANGYWTGSWDAEAQTMTWKLDFGAIKGTRVDTFSDAESYDSTLVMTDKEGKTLLDVQTSHTRVLRK